MFTPRSIYYSYVRMAWYLVVPEIKSKGKLTIKVMEEQNSVEISFVAISPQKE